MNECRNTIEIFRASLGVLRKHKRLIWFPVLSILAIVSLLLFLIPALASGHEEDDLALALVLLAFYFAANLVGHFFQAALTCESLRALRGQNTSVGGGLGCAVARWRSVLALSTITGTVGVMLGVLSGRRGFMRRILELGWALVSYLAVPVMMAEKRGGYQSVVRSGRLLRETWGETAVGEFAIRIVSIQAVLIIVVIASLLSDWLEDPTVFIAASAILVGFFLALETLQAIYRCALYIFVAEGVMPSGFDTPEMHTVWKTK